MRKHMTASLCATALFLTGIARSAPTIPPSAPLIYSLRTDSETVNGWSLGALSGLIGETYRASHEKFLSALQSDVADGSKQQELLRPFACLGVDRATQACRRIVAEKDGVFDQELLALLRSEPTRAARVVDAVVIFDGRFFQVPTHAYDVSLSDQDQLVRSNELRATYINTYSRKLHQEDISTGRNATPFKGKIGSKDARMHYWMGGATPRLTAELDKSVQLLTDLWEATLATDVVGELAGDNSHQDSLPRVRDVVAKDPTPCKTLHGQLLVAKDLGEHLWLITPGQRKDGEKDFLIEPRCGFDY